MAAEVETNRGLEEAPLQGLEEMGSAVLLTESLEDESGFLGFCFRDHMECIEKESAYSTPHPKGRCLLVFHQDPDLQTVYLDGIQRTLMEFLQEQQVTLEEIRWVLPPVISQQFMTSLIERLNLDPKQIPSLENSDRDLRTSSIPAQFSALEKSGQAKPGELGLFINVGAGIQVGCALYQF